MIMIKKASAKKIGKDGAVTAKVAPKPSVVDLKEVIDATVERTPEEMNPSEDSRPRVRRLKNIDQDTFYTAEAIILSGFKAGEDEETIKTTMFNAGIKFSDIIRLYSKITISQGLVRSAKDIKTDIQNFLYNTDFIDYILEKSKTEDITYNHFVSTIENAMFEIRGATERLIVSVMRPILNDHDIDMPAKPKVKKLTVGGKINATIANAFAQNKAMTEDDFKTVVESVTTEKSARKYCKMYKLFSCLANGVGTEDKAI
jgi:hypothetical protein